MTTEAPAKYTIQGIYPGNHEKHFCKVTFTVRIDDMQEYSWADIWQANEEKGYKRSKHPRMEVRAVGVVTYRDVVIINGTHGPFMDDAAGIPRDLRDDIVAEVSVRCGGKPLAPKTKKTN